MVTPQPGALYNETYCILSVIQLRLMQAVLVIMIVIQQYPIFYLVLGDSYSSVYFTEEQRQCQTTVWYRQTVMQYIENFSYTITQILILLIALMQIFEWQAMIMLISAQKGKSLG